MVASRTGRNAELLRRWCAAGRIPCVRVGRDWMIDPGDLALIEAMPRRGMRSDDHGDLADLSVLTAALADALHGCLDEDETIREVIPGIEGSAIIATDRRLFVARDGVLVTEPEHGRVASWPLDWARRVQLTSGASAGALVLTSHDPADRPLVLVLGRPQLTRADDAVVSLRARLADNGNFTDDGDAGS